MKLHISDDLSLPIEAVTEKFAFLGRTGSGKSYAAMKFAEEMARVQAQFVVLDPVGVWYGLRLAADGKSPGIEIPVLGGLRGDIPLEPGGGALIANLVVDRGASMILDVSQFESDAAKARFAHDFADRFFFRKKAAPSAVHIFIDEAQEFVPQNPQREEAKMLHVFTRLLKLGRNFGIGASLLSQRPQEVNKKALNLAEVLFAFQLTGPHERKTVDGWIGDKGIEGEDIDAELPKLERGHPHVWSPAWLKVSRVVSVAPRWTFDASSTPKAGKAMNARDLAPIDLKDLQEKMAATIERAKAEDPRELRKKIAELEKKLRERPPETKIETQIEIREVPVLKNGQLDKAHGFVDRLESLMAKVGETASGLKAAISTATRPAAALPVSHAKPPARTIPQPRPEKSSTANDAPGEIGKSGLRKMMIALAQRPQGMSASQLGVRAGMSSSSGTFGTYLGKARGEGWIDGERSLLRITDAGISALGEYEPLPVGRELLEYWLRDLGDSGAARMLRALAEVYPNAMSKDELGAAAGMSAGSGTFGTYLGKLRSLELCEGKGELRAAAELFD